jgi:AmmeMemoRadiSam system protein A
MRSTRLEPASRRALLRTAASAIETHLAGRPAAPPPIEGLPDQLREHGASFVTLAIGGELRGCCGTLEAERPLAQDVWCNAAASAFHDPRFPPLEPREWHRVSLEVAVLSPRESVTAHSEAELVAQLLPGRHGLVLSWRGRRATFLPKVWQQIAEPRDFVRHLKQKAGWHADFWAADLESWRYETEILVLEHPAAIPERTAH